MNIVNKCSEVFLNQVLIAFNEPFLKCPVYNYLKKEATNILNKN